MTKKKKKIRPRTEVTVDSALANESSVDNRGFFDDDERQELKAIMTEHENSEEHQLLMQLSEEKAKKAVRQHIEKTASKNVSRPVKRSTPRKRSSK